MVSSSRLPVGELQRKAVHAGMGGFALLLPWLTWPQAAVCAGLAFAFNVFALPLLLGHRLRSERTGVSDRGVLVYPLVVLLMVTLFRNSMELAALGWGVLAFGDAGAGVVGQLRGRHRLGWNRGKSWEGFVAFVVAGGVGGSLLAAWYLVMRTPSPAAAGSGGAFLPTAARIVVASAVPLVLAAFLESLPHGLDDNILPPLVAPVALAAVSAGPLFPGAPGDVLAALAVNTVCAVVALGTRVLRPGGVAVAWVLGVTTFLAAGARGFTVLLVFLLAGTALTFLGFASKRARGTAERSGGRRGAPEILAKGGVLMAFAFTALLSEGGGTLGWWVVAAILGAASADTWGTEVGSLLGRRPFTLFPVRRVVPGTPGAISWAGLAASLAGAAFVVAVAVALSGPAAGVGLPAILAVSAFLAALSESILPALGPATHAGKNVAVTFLGVLFALALLGVLT